MTMSDDALATEVIGLLRDIKGQQDMAAQKASAVERAVLSLTQSVAALDDRRISSLVVALWGLAVAFLFNGIFVAAAILVAIRGLAAALGA
jgi:hypothetical protein